MATLKPNMLRPALIGAAVGAALSLIPPLCCLNVCCCLDLAIGGLVAGALYAGAASRIGWFAGVEEGLEVGAIAGVLSGAAVGVAGAAGEFAGWLAALRFHPWRSMHAAWDLDDAASLFTCGGAPFIARLAGAAFGPALFGLAAGALGGTLGVLIFRATPAGSAVPSPAASAPADASAPTPPPPPTSAASGSAPTPPPPPTSAASGSAPTPPPTAGI